MFLLALLVICVATVPVAGGRLARLADLGFRRRWAGFAALAVQVAIMRVFPHGDPVLHGVLHLVSYALMFYFLAANLAIPGLWLIGLGGGLNAMAIAANDGVMPARPEALATAGIVQVPGEFVNSGAVADPKLWFLGDVFALPAGWPMANVFSVGDVLLIVGAFVLLHRQCRSAAAPRLERLAAWVRRTGPRAEVLRDHRAFRRLWVAQAVSGLGDWIFPPAVFAALLHRDAAVSELALLLIAQVGPGMLVGLFGGPFIDRFSRKWLMVGTDVVRAGAVASLLFVGTPSLVHVYAVSLLLGVAGAVFQPAFMAAIPDLLPRRHLAGGNALVGLTQSVAIMVGLPLGGVIVHQFGTAWGFSANAVSFAFSGALVAGTVFPAAAARAGGRRRLWQELKDGLAYVARDRTVRSVVVVVALIAVAAGVKSPLEPLFAFDTLDAGSAGYGLLGAAWGVGMITGSLVASAADRRLGHGRLLAGSATAVGLAVLAASAAPSLAPVLALWVVGGVANAAGTVAYETLLQEETAEAMRGRVMAVLEAALQAGLLVGVGAAAFSDAAFGAADPARAGLALGGLCFAAAGFAGWRLLVRRRAATRTPSFRLEGLEVVPAGAGYALLRVTAAGAHGAPVLIVDDGQHVHRLEPLPGGAGPADAVQRFGYGVPRQLLGLRRAALALDLGAGRLLDLPRPAGEPA